MHYMLPMLTVFLHDFQSISRDFEFLGESKSVIVILSIRRSVECRAPECG